MTEEFKIFLPIAKINENKRTVSGYASTPTEDSDGEIVTLDAIKAALPDYMQYANIREMHQLKAVGKAQEANTDEMGLFITAKIIDDQAWQKCLEKVYTGFSIGGRKLDKKGKKITKLNLSEISIVDRPANGDCTFAIAKNRKELQINQIGYLIKEELTAEQKAIKKMAKAVESMAKANPPAAHDGFSLPAKTKEDIDKTNENNIACEAHGKIDCVECKKVINKEKEDKKPYGDVDYADKGYQEDGIHRYPINTEEHIRAAWNYINQQKNYDKYKPEDGAKVKSAIVSAWKAHIDASGPASAQSKEEKKKAKKIAKAELYKALGIQQFAFLTLGKKEKVIKEETFNEPDWMKLDKTPMKKSMQSAGDLSYIFDSIRRAQRSLLMEGKREGGDKKDHQLADKLGTIAKQLADVIGQKALHEGMEASTLTDADDQWVNTLLGEKDMTKGFGLDNGDELDPLSKAILNVVQKAAQPTRAQRMAKAEEDLDKSRKAMKAARKGIEECHKMLKASYMAKAAKKDGKDQEDEFDHAECMGKLNKAYSDLKQARDMSKSASDQITKAMTRAGQRGQEAGDAEPGFYEVPPGVKDLTPAAMAGAAPGTTQQLGQPPVYPGDGSVYAGKADNANDLMKFAKNGMVPVAVAELLAKQQQMEGELEIYRRMPAGGRQRPFMFDTSKITAGGDGSTVADLQKRQDMNKTLFAGVDVNAIGGGDEARHTQEVGKAIGNYLTSGMFARSIFDPNFKGTVGG